MWDKLSPMERRVYQELLTDLNVRDIAAKFGRSVHTIRVHTRSIYRKLHINSRSELLKLQPEMLNDVAADANVADRRDALRVGPSLGELEHDALLQAVPALEPSAALFDLTMCHLCCNRHWPNALHQERDLIGETLYDVIPGSQTFLADRVGRAIAGEPTSSPMDVFIDAAGSVYAMGSYVRVSNDGHGAARGVLMTANLLRYPLIAPAGNPRQVTDAIQRADLLNRCSARGRSRPFNVELRIARDPLAARLGPRSMRVLRALVDGQSDEEIAAAASLSKGSVAMEIVHLLTHFKTAGLADLRRRFRGES